MSKRAYRVVAGIEDGQWWLTSYFEYGYLDDGSNHDDVEWKGTGEYEVPTEGPAFEYLKGRYANEVIYDRHTKFEYDETYLPAGTPVRVYGGCAKAKNGGAVVERVFEQWRLVRYELEGSFKRLTGRKTTVGWYHVGSMDERKEK